MHCDWLTDTGSLIQIGKVPLEKLASGWAIANSADTRAWRGESRGSVLLHKVDGETQFITTKHVADAAEKGDEFALSLLRDAAGHLAEAICDVIALLCP